MKLRTKINEELSKHGIPTDIDIEEEAEIFIYQQLTSPELDYVVYDTDGVLHIVTKGQDTDE